ncbi:ferritin-like domain-containing protein [Rhizobium helianthi]|uniref:Ferritin-like domain-containing protein n=1 Tax=Rhizobium helianthi TaxID=1132695 RepID=A0ABW4M265_9HYPH
MSQTIDARQLVVTGLKNAHAMEKQALSIMRPQLSRIENYPAVATRLEQHIQETEGQIGRIEEILTSLAEDHSTLKDIGLSLSGSMAALGHTMAGDEILKDSFANFAFENFEIAAYTSLITLAEHGGFSGLISPLKANLDEELAMAQWIEDNLASVTLEYASRRESGQPAKI